MKGVARFLIRLYPANWRARYGEEFEALLEDSSSGWPAVFDLFKGAIRMQFFVPAFPKLALMLSITGLLIGLLVSALVTPTYTSEAVLVLEGSVAGSARPAVEYLMQLEQEVLSRTSLKGIIEDPRLNLYPEGQAKKPLEDVIEEMRKDIQIRMETPANAGQGRVAFSVAFYYRDRAKARDTVQALVTHFSEANLNRQRAAQSAAGQLDQFHRLEARVALLEKRLGVPSAAPESGDQFAGYMGVNLEVIDPPSLPVLPVKPNRTLFMFFGFGAGFAAALVIAIFRRRPPPMPLPAQTA